ncbi:MAG: tol-pal system protein YbgF [Alphaproteobacteria bacterium]|nr:tol-pal system protein YbgF [Alphaproteobacteria bacterium]
MLERLDRLEQQLGRVQNRLETSINRPAPVVKPGEPLPPTAAARMELRVSQLENEIRRLTGRAEEIDFSVQQIKSRLDRLVSDVDQRLAVLEGRPPQQADAQRGRSALPAQSSQPESQVASAETTASGGGEPAGAQLAALPPGSVEQQYQHARAFLVQGAYDEAEASLRSFIQAHPDHTLAGNAQYWLGETFYVRKQYEDAVVAYLEGYQKYPKSRKAPDNLLKLGMSLAQLGKKDEACATFTQLRQKFPKARSNIRQTAASQRKKLGC